jgi:cell wall-associated NlpC family hydrolase
LKYALYLLFVAAAGCTASKQSMQKPVVETAINEVKQQYAPDSRTALFAVTVNGNVLKGETNNPAAKTALWQRLPNKEAYIDSVEVLPAAGLQQKHFASVTISVANLRSQPRHAAELSTQALLGTPLKVWKKEKGWYLVQTPDHYLAWVDGGAITLMDSTRFQQWSQQAQLIYTQPYGFAYTEPAKTAATVSDLVYGSQLTIISTQEGFYKVQYPDGRIAYIPNVEAMPYAQWAASRQPTGSNMVATARRLMGLPYLWGGTSTKGVDCSGFTKTVYLMNGLVLPRDASQQVHIGTEVDTKQGWDNLQPGDLLFFGSPARDGRPERVVHVGMWIGGNAEFIHSASLVRINSLNPQAPNYDEDEHKRFLRAKRITPQAALIDLRQGVVGNKL